MATAGRRFHTTMPGHSSGRESVLGVLRTPPPINSKSDSPSASFSRVVRRPQRPPFRRAAPAPPRRVPPPTIDEGDSDPFTDISAARSNIITLVEADPIVDIPTYSYSSSPPPSGRVTTRIESESYASSSSSTSAFYQPPGLSLSREHDQQAALAHAARLKFVAGTLMYRVHCHARPLRRIVLVDPCASAMMRRSYVRSGLSRMVSLDAD